MDDEESDLKLVQTTTVNGDIWWYLDGKRISKATAMKLQKLHGLIPEKRSTSTTFRSPSSSRSPSPKSKKKSPTKKKQTKSPSVSPQKSIIKKKQPPRGKVSTKKKHRVKFEDESDSSSSSESSSDSDSETEFESDPESEFEKTFFGKSTTSSSDDESDYDEMKKKYKDSYYKRHDRSKPKKVKFPNKNKAISFVDKPSSFFEFSAVKKPTSDLPRVAPQFEAQVGALYSDKRGKKDAKISNIIHDDDIDMIIPIPELFKEYRYIYSVDKTIARRQFIITDPDFPVVYWKMGQNNKKKTGTMRDAVRANDKVLKKHKNKYFKRVVAHHVDHHHPDYVQAGTYKKTEVFVQNNIFVGSFVFDYEDQPFISLNENLYNIVASRDKIKRNSVEYYAQIRDRTKSGKLRVLHNMIPQENYIPDSTEMVQMVLEKDSEDGVTLFVTDQCLENEIQIGKRISKGLFGVVHEGVYKYQDVIVRMVLVRGEGYVPDEKYDNFIGCANDMNQYSIDCWKKENEIHQLASKIGRAPKILKAWTCPAYRPWKNTMNEKMDFSDKETYTTLFIAMEKFDGIPIYDFIQSAPTKDMAKIFGGNIQKLLADLMRGGVLHLGINGRNTLVNPKTLELNVVNFRHAEFTDPQHVTEEQIKQQEEFVQGTFKDWYNVQLDYKK